MAWPSRLGRVHLPRSSTPLTVARTSGPAPPKHLPLSLLPHPLGTAFPIPAQKNDPGPAGSSSGMSPQPPPGPDLQVGFEVITSAQPRAASCSEPLQASRNLLGTSTGVWLILNVIKRFSFLLSRHAQFPSLLSLEYSSSEVFFFYFPDFSPQRRPLLQQMQILCLFGLIYQQIVFVQCRKVFNRMWKMSFLPKH